MGSTLLPCLKQLWCVRSWQPSAPQSRLVSTQWEAPRTDSKSLSLLCTRWKVGWREPHEWLSRKWHASSDRQLSWDSARRVWRPICALREGPVAQLVLKYHGAADWRARELAPRQLPSVDSSPQCMPGSISGSQTAYLCLQGAVYLSWYCLPGDESRPIGDPEGVWKNGPAAAPPAQPAKYQPQMKPPAYDCLGPSSTRPPFCGTRCQQFAC